jgi:hypothetical protein
VPLTGCLPACPLVPVILNCIRSSTLWLIQLYWHEYVLHEGITYKSHVLHTSQTTSRLLRHTAAAMRAHNVLCNSYNTRPLLCERITCYVTVITVEINHCSFRRVRFALLYVFRKNLLRHHSGNWYVHCVTQELKMLRKQVRVTCICMR